MKLIIDIGNTVAKLVAFDGDEPIEEIRTSNDSLSALGAFAAKYAFTHGIVGTVKELTAEAEEQLRNLHIPILHFSHETPVPITNRYRSPKTLGADRLAAAVGARSLKPGKDLLIIDAGTCITYEVIDAKGNYWGGNIAPGMQMRLRALNEFTAKLPLVSAEGNVPGMGYDTETAIRSGVLRGMKYEIEGYIRSMRSKYPKLLVFLTGGDKINFDATIKSIIFADKFIVPRGLNKILDYNHDKK
ncbi:MAG: type III pantothenate kinase [Bacteroidaceae bacterium]|nr:type III pantothenate kinase [Bacteroidaceae bacterium]MBO5742007.1 type III pantothenate kinase [Bacteroidaceae bacterium]MBO5784532.1 type III pantothenate kinase [Bacteroidaceae bacterium]MBO5886014.1 type III pantothenate kinase [Bacteroidaceae bacterium]MBQ2044669.1 type III pantothenate kinase [Bacteroidaceae bacterium]